MNHPNLEKYEAELKLAREKILEHNKLMEKGEKARQESLKECNILLNNLVTALVTAYQRNDLRKKLKELCIAWVIDTDEQWRDFQEEMMSLPISRS